MGILKKIVVAGVAVSAIFMTGCIEDILDDTDSVSLGTLTPSHQNINLTTEATVKVDVDASVDVSATDFSFVVTNKAGETSTDLNVRVQYTSGKKGTATITIAPTSTCPTDTYTVSVTLTLPGTTTSASKSFTVGVTGKTDPIFDLDTATYTVGSKSSSVGSNIDLDAGKVYTATEVDSIAKTLIDLFYFTKSDGTDYIYSPSVAVGVTTGTNSTKIVKLTSVVDFDTVTTEAEVAGLWTTYGSTATVDKFTCVKGDLFLVETDKSAHFLVYVNDQVPGESGTITIKSAK